MKRYRCRSMLSRGREDGRRDGRATQWVEGATGSLSGRRDFQDNSSEITDVVRSACIPSENLSQECEKNEGDCVGQSVEEGFPASLRTEK